MRKRWVLGSALFLLTLMLTMPLMAQGDLTQTFTTSDGHITVSYPDGWSTQEQSGLVGVYNSQSPTGREIFGAVASGEAVLLVIPSDVPTFGQFIQGDTPEAAVTTLTSAFTGGTGTASDVTSLTVGSYPAARVLVTTPDSEEVFIVMDVGNGQKVWGLGSAHPGELANYEPTFDAILATVQLVGLPGGPVVEVSGEAPKPTSNAPTNLNLQPITTANAAQVAQIWSTQVTVSCLTSAVFSPDGKTIAACDQQNGGLLLNSATGELIQTLKGNNVNRAYQELYSPDGQTLYTAADELGLLKWDLAAGTETNTSLAAPDTIVMQMANSPDGSKVAYITQYPAIIGLLSADGTKTETALELGYNGANIAYSPQGDMLLYSLSLGMGNTDIWLWDIAQSKHGDMIEVQGSPLNLFYTPDGKPIAVTYDVHTDDVMVWDVTSNTMTAQMKGHTQQVTHAALSPDGTILATTSWDLSVRLWDIQTGQQLASLPHQNEDLHAIFSADSKMLLTTDQLGNTVLWGINQP